ncbi:MAG: hypothetical protein EOP33_09660, partial [Rickettsiaceae bacterium]
MATEVQVTVGILSDLHNENYDEQLVEIAAAADASCKYLDALTVAFDMIGAMNPARPSLIGQVWSKVKDIVSSSPPQTAQTPPAEYPPADASARGGSLLPSFVGCGERESSVVPQEHWTQGRGPFRPVQTEEPRNDIPSMSFGAAWPSQPQPVDSGTLPNESWRTQQWGDCVPPLPGIRLFDQPLSFPSAQQQSTQPSLLYGVTDAQFVSHRPGDSGQSNPYAMRPPPVDPQNPFAQVRPNTGIQYTISGRPVSGPEAYVPQNFYSPQPSRASSDPVGSAHAAPHQVPSQSYGCPGMAQPGVGEGGNMPMNFACPPQAPAPPAPPMGMVWPQPVQQGKDADRIVLPVIPNNAIEYRTWRRAVHTAVVVASRDPVYANTWIEDMVRYTSQA